ncbi:MAG: type VI secretion system contractile sheath large subunit [Bryobacteraceae bacterium]|jgi:type VI secretion system protein ImpC
MSKPSSFADVELAVNPGAEPQAQRLEPETPFRVLILGDFSGRANRGVFETRAGTRRAVRIDRDSFDAVFEKLRPELLFPLAGSPSPALAIRFKELDDFHPDRLFERVDVFQALRELREKLSDSATFAAAAAALRPAEAPPPPAAPAKITLDDLLDDSNGGSAGPARALDDWSAMLHELVAPHLVPGADPRQVELIARVDAATSEAMRALLHQPAFQELEAAWQALFFLVRRLETGPELKLYLLDVSKAELAAELETARDDLRHSELWRMVVEESVGTLGGQPWAILAGSYSFSQSPGDLKLLARLGAIAREAGAPFLAATSPRMLENITAGAFSQIRKLPQAPWIGLALPRFLLRLPYGKDTAPVELFAFEEFGPAPEHESYLWGNPAFACVYLLGEAFRQAGWDMQPGLAREIDGLPLHVYKEDGESKVKPCAEVLMTEEGAEALLENGVMPLASIRDRDAVRLIRFQSIADPLAPLAGRWRG